MNLLAYEKNISGILPLSCLEEPLTKEAKNLFVYFDAMITGGEI